MVPYRTPFFILLLRWANCINRMLAKCHTVIQMGILNALLILSIMDVAAPALPNALWKMHDANRRTRLTAVEGDDDEF